MRVGQKVCPAHGPTRNSLPAAVHIFLDNGESVVTDSTGATIPMRSPGVHALWLDAKTLQPGTMPYDDRNINSDKSIRRLVHVRTTR